MPVLVSQDVRNTGVHVAVTVQSHLGSIKAINREIASGECWLTDGVSVIDNILVSVHYTPHKRYWGSARLTCNCRGSSHDGEEGQDGKAKTMPSYWNGHHDRLSC